MLIVIYIYLKGYLDYDTEHTKTIIRTRHILQTRYYWKIIA